jgi:hypothetical protein
MGTDGNSGSDPSGVRDRGQTATVPRHDFSYRVTVPVVWHVEYSPNASMSGGQVFYETPGGNVLIASFVPLGEVAEKFETIDRYRDASIARIRNQANISGKLALSEELTICGHRAILSNLQGDAQAGSSADIWSLDVWCDVTNRCYSLYGDFSQRGEFPHVMSTFTSIARSLVCHTPRSGSQRPAWEWADLGFDTKSRIWFLQLFNYSGVAEIFQAREILLTGGSAVQYQWPQIGLRPMWHVRERIFSREVGTIEYDEEGRLVVEHVTEVRAKEQVPETYESITYAYSISTARGILEFRDRDNTVVKRIDDRWIVVENLARKTIGEFPDIRLTVRREDIENILLTDTCVIIQGKTGHRVV